MPTVTIPNVRIAGLSAAVPPVEEFSWSEIPNAECFDTARSRGKTPYRRTAHIDQCQSDFCVDAATTLLVALGWVPGSIDAVVMATLTPDYPIPATAIIVQDRLGIPKSAAAFDLPSGSLGFLHGLQLVASMLNPGSMKRALLLCGQVAKTVGPPDDLPPHRAIHGHSGSVCALEFSEDAEPMHFDTGGDGTECDAFYMPVGGVRNPPRPEMFKDAAGLRYASEYVLDLGRIGARAHDELPASMLRVLEVAGLTSRDIDACYLSDLPLPVESAIRRELHLPIDRVHGVSPDYGESGSGTIPLAMLTRSASRFSMGKQISLLSAMGPGLAWGSALITTDSIACPELLEI
jgi:3-oxoacyl-[acyl-carrier-protein] synthase-3